MGLDRTNVAKYREARNCGLAEDWLRAFGNLVTLIVGPTPPLC
jgi:hypothetical protein